MDMTVVIPTYNGASRFPTVLDRLRVQATPTNLDWEVIVVDNNSQDETAEIVKQYQDQGFPVSLRYSFEPQQGLAYARQCGVEQAQGRWVGFLDDDNWPAPDWVAMAVQFGHAHPQVGVYGGKTVPVFECPPAMPVKAISKLLALQDYGSSPYQFQPERQILPAGAGLVVRREAWLSCIPKTLVRISNGGDDYEISLRIAKQGWDIYYTPEMAIEHYIPKARLERSYLLKLAYRYGLCTCELMLIEVPLWQQPLLTGKFLAGTLKRMAAHVTRHGWTHPDVNIQYRLRFYMGNLNGLIVHLLKPFVGINC